MGEIIRRKKLPERSINRRYKKFLKIVNGRNVVEKKIVIEGIDLKPVFNTMGIAPNFLPTDMDKSLVLVFKDGREGTYRGPLVKRYLMDLAGKELISNIRTNKNEI